MSDALTEARKLREQDSLRDLQTGRVVQKPRPPAMREGVQGAWSYRETVPERRRPAPDDSQHG
jgi:hypothetical protein